MRMAMMVIGNIIAFPYYLLRIVLEGKFRGKEKAFLWIKHVCKRANKAGKVEVIPFGLENLPEKDGYVMFPNHQGFYDVMTFLETCPRPFSFVYKKEVGNIILLKQVIGALRSIGIDRSDLRQSMQVIKEMTERVSNGENFLIFAEGTRSKLGNRMIEMKPGSFKSAVKAKAPIVPCALIDSYKPFDQKGLQKVKVEVHYLKPIYYDEYKDMDTVEISQEVRRRIEEVLFTVEP